MCSKQVKTDENDGCYKAVQVGFVDKRDKLVSKPVKGTLRQGWCFPTRDSSASSGFENAEEYSVKDEIKADIFANSDKVDATAIPKVKVSGRDQETRHTEDLWLMVLNSIVIRVPTVLVLIRARHSRSKGMPGHMGLQADYHSEP